MVLLPEAVLDNQDGEEQKTQEVCPDVDRLIVQPEDAKHAVLVVQSLSVTPGNCYHNLIIWDLCHIDKHKRILLFLFSVFYFLKSKNCLLHEVCVSQIRHFLAYI